MPPGYRQSAIRFMARLDEALEFNDPQVHESVTVALEALLKAQFANGAFPQIWTGPVPNSTTITKAAPGTSYMALEIRAEHCCKRSLASVFGNSHLMTRPILPAEYFLNTRFWLQT